MLISASQLLIQGWKAYIKNLKHLLPYMGLSILLGILLMAIVGGFFYLAFITSSGLLYFLTLLVYLAAICTGIYVGLWIQVALLKSAKAVVDGKPMALKETFKSTRHLILPFFGTNILRTVLLIAGFMLFIVPGIILAVRYAFAVMATVYDEPKEGAAAIRLSKDMVRGRWWGMLGRWLLTYVLFIVVLLFVSWLVSLPFSAKPVQAQSTEQLNTGSYTENPYHADTYDAMPIMNDTYDLDSSFDYNPYSKFEMGVSEIVTPRFIAYEIALIVLSILFSPLLIVYGALLYKSAKENPVPKV
jgi:hypothetical protein